jgi:hypothetical protein
MATQRLPNSVNKAIMSPADRVKRIEEAVRRRNAPSINGAMGAIFARGREQRAKSLRVVAKMIAEGKPLPSELPNDGSSYSSRRGGDALTVR